MPTIQDFSVPADSDHDVIITVESSIVGDTLIGSTIHWCAYEQALGSPVPSLPPVISKVSPSGGIVILESPPMTFVVLLAKADTALLLRNYYHEATVVDALGNVNPVTVGIMTVTATENRF